MELKEYRFDEVTINFDKKRVPLSGAQREKRQGKYRYYGAQGVIDHIDDFIFDGTYLLIAEDGENLKSKKQNIAQVVEGQFWVNNHAHIVQGNELCDTRYLSYLLNGIDLSGYVTGSAQPKLSQANLNAVTLFLPPIFIQKKIVDYLYLFDKKIAVNQQINDHLQQQAAELYKSWFVEFSSATTCKMIDSEIGKIPYGWRVYRLSEFLPVITGKKNANVSSEKGKYPFFSCSQDFSWTDDYSFEGNAILVAGNGDFNVKWYKGRFEAYQRTYVLIPYEERYTSWLYYAVKNNLARITSAARGSVIKFITKGNLEDFAFAAPSDLCSCEIIDTFAAINRKIDCLTQENYRLAAIRDALLPRLMSGEIDVSGIDI